MPNGKFRKVQEQTLAEAVKSLLLGTTEQISFRSGRDAPILESD